MKRTNHHDHHQQLKQQKPPTKHHSLLGILLIMLGSFSFSCMFVLVKLMEGTANSFTLVFYRSIVQFTISYISIIVNEEYPILGQVQARKWLLVRGGLGAGAVLAFFYAIQNLPLPDAVTLQFTTPPFAAAFAVCLANEKWMKLDMIGAVICILGVALIAHSPSSSSSSSSTESSSSVSALSPPPSDDDTYFLTGGGTSNITILQEDVVDDEITITTTEDPFLLKAIAIGVALLGAAMAGMAYMSVRVIGNRASANVMVLYYSTMSIPLAIFGSKLFLGEYNVWGCCGGDGPSSSSSSSWYSTSDYLLFLLTGLAGYGGQYFTNMGLLHETAATVSPHNTVCVLIFVQSFELRKKLLKAHSLCDVFFFCPFFDCIGFFGNMYANRMDVHFRACLFA